MTAPVSSVHQTTATAAIPQTATGSALHAPAVAYVNSGGVSAVGIPTPQHPQVKTEMAASGMTVLAPAVHAPYHVAAPQSPLSTASHPPFSAYGFYAPRHHYHSRNTAVNSGGLVTNNTRTGSSSPGVNAVTTEGNPFLRPVPAPYLYAGYPGQYPPFHQARVPSMVPTCNFADLQQSSVPHQQHTTSSQPQQQQRSASDSYLLIHMARLVQRCASALSDDPDMLFSTRLERVIIDAIGSDKELSLQFVLTAFELLQQEPIIVSSHESHGPESQLRQTLVWNVNLDGLALLLRIVRMASDNSEILSYIQKRFRLHFDAEALVAQTDQEFHLRFFFDLETKIEFKIRSNEQEDTNSATQNTTTNPQRVQFFNIPGTGEKHARVESDWDASIAAPCLVLDIDSFFTLVSDRRPRQQADFCESYAVERIDPPVGHASRKQRLRMIFKHPESKRQQARPNRFVSDTMFHAQLNNGIQARIEGIYGTHVELIMPPVRAVGSVDVELYHCGVRVSSCSFSVEQEPGSVSVSVSQKVSSGESKEDPRGELQYVRDCYRFTLLHMAAFLGFGSLCKVLVSRCGIPVDIMDCSRGTALYWAIQNNKRETVLALVEAGASLALAQGPQSLTAVDIARSLGFHEIVKDIETMTAHTDKGISPVAFLSTTHPDSLLAMFKLGKSRELEEALSRPISERQIKALDEQLNTPLHLAVKSNMSHLVSLLLTQGAPTNVVNKLCESPLQCAVAAGNIELVSMLIERGGANVNLRGNPFSNTPLHVAVGNGDLQIVHYLLGKRADCNAKAGPLEQTALHLAVSLGLKDIASSLVLHGASVRIVDRQGKSALDLADGEMKDILSGAERQYWQHSNSHHHHRHLHNYQHEHRGAAFAVRSTFEKVLDSNEGTQMPAVTKRQPKNGQRGSAPRSMTIDTTSRRRGKRSRMSIEESTLTPTLLSSAESPFEAIDTDGEARKLEKTWPAKILLKPSRRKHEHIDFFPPELCSSPYKYDIVIILPHSEVHPDQLDESNFRFRILVQVNDDHWEEVVNGITLIRLLRNVPHSARHQEIEWRIMFTVCSFHFQRKPFKLQVVHSKTPFERKPGECDPAYNNESSGSTPTSPVSVSSAAKHNQLVLPQHTSPQLSEGQRVVYESRGFLIVARKKKETYFWATRKFKQRAQGSPSGSSSETSTPRTPIDAQNAFPSPSPVADTLSEGGKSEANAQQSTLAVESTLPPAAPASIMRIPIPSFPMPPSAATAATTNQGSSFPHKTDDTSQKFTERPVSKKQRLLRDHIAPE